MAATRAWAENVPADTEAASQGASRIRQFRVDVRERMALDHIWNDSVDTDGRHKKVTLLEQGSDPDNISDYGIVYTKDIDGVTELFYIDSAGTVSQLTKDGQFASPLKLPIESGDPSAEGDTVILYAKDVDPGGGDKAELFVVDEDGDTVQLTEGGKLKVLRTSNAWEASQATAESELTDGAGIDLDASLSNAFRVMLGGNRTLNEPTNGKDGQCVTLRVIQDAAGSRTLSFASAFRKPDSLDLTLSTAANAEDLLVLLFLGGTWRVMSIQREIASAV